MATLQLEVVTPEKAVFSQVVDDVVLPGSQGQMDILPGHLPLLSTLGVGEMIIRFEGTERSFFVDQGYVEVLDDRVTVLTEECLGASEIDIEAARRDLARFEKEMLSLEERSKTEPVEEELYELHRLALRRERVRLAFAEESSE